MTLSHLEADTIYCVQALIITRNLNPSEASRPVCERTGHSRCHILSVAETNERIKSDTTAKLPIKHGNGLNCVARPTGESAPWVAAVVTCVVLGATALLLVLAVANRDKIYHFLCPKESIPQVCVLVS